MDRNDVIIRKVFFSVIIGLILGTSGCIGTPQPNAINISANTRPETHNALSTPQQPPTSVSPTQNQTITPVTVVTTLTPHFYGTLSFGSNRSSALTEDQAWKYADAFFLKIGLRDLQPAEIVPLGQKTWKDMDGNQEMVWSFHVHRIVMGTHEGGMISIDAYDGHVVDFSGYQ
ncbi:hypothetical protein [Methanoregula sp.]|uniref:hypothetical protein n=1 Tax=Methanoregula sp. TaxID=2052170 RepID=UPI00356B0081